MILKVNITENNHEILKRQLEHYNIFNDTNMTLDQFTEMILIDGLLGKMNGIDVRSKRSGCPWTSVSPNGEIIEYR